MVHPQPVSVNGGTVPMILDETGECVIVEGYENDVIEIELGRLNGVRVGLTNPRILDRHLYDVVNTINASQGIKLDLAGRLAYGVQVEDGVDGDGNPVYKTVYKTVDSPRAGLALYWALMRWGKLEGTVEIMEEGAWVSKPISITLDDTVLDAEGLGYLKRGNAECQADPVNCGIKRRPSGYVDYSAFTHNSQTDFAGIDVSFVERLPEGSACVYADRTEDLWTRILESDASDYANIAAFVKQAEDTRNIIQFIHTVIQDPVPAP